MDALLGRAVALWRESPDALAPAGRAFAASEQQAREQALDRFLEVFQGELQNPPYTRPARQAAHDRINDAFVAFAQAALDLQPRHLELLLAGGFSAIGTEMGRAARSFDPQVSAADILQASRNAWTACGLQTLLGSPMRLTPPIFAYSMLYPYTDNYLDDPGVAREAKLGFSGRFGERLAGCEPGTGKRS